jgi:hypothetical protein
MAFCDSGLFTSISKSVFFSKADSFSFSSLFVSALDDSSFLI